MSGIPDDVLAAAKAAAYEVEGTQEEGWITSVNGVDVIARAIFAERERCAKVAEGYGDGGLEYDLEPEATVATSVASKSIAAAIRAGATA